MNRESGTGSNQERTIGKIISFNMNLKNSKQNNIMYV